MKIKKSELRQMILQEMHSMRRDHEQHDELFNALMHSAGGCPKRAGSMLQDLMNRVSAHASQEGRDMPNPATSGVIPQGEELMGDEAYMEEKKVTGYRGAGGAVGILGPGFR